MQRHKKFWNKEYKEKEHIALSTEPAEDLEKFVRWLERQKDSDNRRIGFVLDVGCGNGRNLIHLSKTFGVRGLGFDISEEAIVAAQRDAAGLPLEFRVGAMTEALPCENDSVDLALDMMSSHYLRRADREKLRDEISRVLVPGGWLFFKSFLKTGDEHAARLLREHPGGEEGTYIHPRVGVPEHVWSEEEVYDFFRPHFTVERFRASFLHRLRGKAFKRRTFVAYLRKN